MHPPSSIYSTCGKFCPFVQWSIAVGGSYPLCALDAATSDVYTAPISSPLSPLTGGRDSDFGSTGGGCKSLVSLLSLVACCWQSGWEHFSSSNRWTVTDRPGTNMQLFFFAAVTSGIIVFCSSIKPAMFFKYTFQQMTKLWCHIPIVSIYYRKWLIPDDTILSNNKNFFVFIASIERCMPSSLYMPLLAVITHYLNVHTHTEYVHVCFRQNGVPTFIWSRNDVSTE